MRMRVEPIVALCVLGIWAYGAWHWPLGTFDLDHLAFKLDPLSMICALLGLPLGAVGVFLLLTPIWNKRRYF